MRVLNSSDCILLIKDEVGNNIEVGGNLNEGSLESDRNVCIDRWKVGREWLIFLFTCTSLLSHFYVDVENRKDVMPYWNQKNTKCCSVEKRERISFVLTVLLLVSVVVWVGDDAVLRVKGTMVQSWLLSSQIYHLCRFRVDGWWWCERNVLMTKTMKGPFHQLGKMADAGHHAFYFHPSLILSPSPCPTVSSLTASPPVSNNFHLPLSSFWFLHHRSVSLQLWPSFYPI